MIPIGTYTLMLTADHRKRIDIMHVTLNAQRNIDRYIMVEIYYFPYK